MREIWKDITGYEGKYQVSNLGRVKRLAGYYCCGHRNEQKHIIKEQIMKPCPNKKGYLLLKISDGIHRKTFQVHRLVAMMFIPNPDNLPQVNHKDENKANNCVDNLEWCTNEYNSNYGTGRKRQAAKNTGRKLSEETKKKISIANSGANNGMYGKPSWNKGKKGLQTAWNKGIPCCEETKRKISDTKRKKAS